MSKGLYLRASLLALALVSCAPEVSATYVGDAQGGAFARLPGTWTAFNAGEFLSFFHKAPAAPAPGQVIYAFAEDGSIDSVLTPGPAPAGILEVRPVPQPLTREQALDVVFGNVTQLQEQGLAMVSPISDFPDEVAARIDLDLGGTQAVFLQRVAEQEDGRVRIFVVGCSQRCFEDNNQQIEQAFRSVVAAS